MLKEKRIKIKKEMASKKRDQKNRKLKSIIKRNIGIAKSEIEKEGAKSECVSEKEKKKEIELYKRDEEISYFLKKLTSASF